MNMRMNGWHRLWIMVAAIWFCIVAIAAWYMRPKPESVPHRKEFLLAVSPQSAMYECPWTATQQDCEKQAKVVVEMPNGYHFLLALDDKEDGPAAAKSYWKAVEIEAWEQQKRAVHFAFWVWLIPSIVALLIGHGAAWVWRGFKFAQMKGEQTDEIKH
jgi:hypothetical protein